MLAKPRVIVIGAGLAGLAIALRLALRGWQVTIYEQGAAPGGKMNRWVKDGFTFDTGPSLLTMPWVFSELFEIAGADIQDHILMEPVEPLAAYVFNDGVRFRASASLPEWLKTIRELEPSDEQGFLNFMRLGSKIFGLSEQTFFRTSPFQPPDIKSISALRHMPLRHAWGGYSRSVRHFFKSPHLRQLYERFPTYVGSSPYRLPATLMVIPYLEHAFGGWYLKGGLYSLIESLVALKPKNGSQHSDRKAGSAHQVS
jgi:phytoene desaturase